VSFPLLFINEGRAVKRTKALKEGSGAVVSIQADKVNAANNGKLVHLSGMASTGEELADPTFAVSSNALKLRRVVEMYQWEEDESSKTDKNVGGSTTTKTSYKYDKVWSDQLIDSNRFNQAAKYTNPTTMAYESQEWVAKDAKLGAFRLSPTLIGKITVTEPLSLERDTTVPEEIDQPVKVQGQGFYIGENPASPTIGDLRIRYEVVPPTTISVVAKQTDENLDRYSTKAGSDILLLESGTLSAKQMFEREHSNNKMLTWILRLVGFVMMFIGFCMLFKPLSVLADILPIFGNIVGAGTALVSVLLAACLSLLTISIAWVFYRPVLGILLLAISGVIIYLLRNRLKEAKPQPQPQLA
ncbi:MAG: TMEM43 family protein, partial [Akkermansiaceae bacterium]|nr:TMEM43 family protein [Akkermansiaceae bacterium]